MHSLVSVGIYFIKHVVYLLSVKAGNFMAGDFLAHRPLLETLWPETFRLETFSADTLYW